MKKRWFNIVLMVFAAVFLTISGVQATDYHYTAHVYKYDGSTQGLQLFSKSETTLIETGVTYQVNTAGSTTAATIYAAGGWGKGASKTNPVTTTYFLSDGDGYVGKIDFWATTSTVDLIVVDTAGGYTAIVAGFSPKMRTVVIDETPNKMHHGLIWYNMSTTTEVTTGVVFPYPVAIHDVRPEVVGAGSAATTIGVGLLSTGSGGSATGFISGRLVSTAGMVQDTAFITSGGSVDYYPVTTYGTFLATGVTGDGTLTATKYKNGGLTRLSKFVLNSASTRSLTYTASSADGSSKGGFIHYWFTKLR